MIKYVHHCRIAILGRTPDAELALMGLDPLFDAGRAYPVKPGKGVFTLWKPCSGTRTALVRYLLQLMDRTIPLSKHFLLRLLSHACNVAAKYDVMGFENPSHRQRWNGSRSTLRHRCSCTLQHSEVTKKAAGFWVSGSLRSTANYLRSHVLD